MTPAFPGVRVVGMHFRGPEAKEYAATLRTGERLFIEREPENPYDQNAIKVLTRDGLHLGYIEREQAAWISGWLDEGNTFTATVSHLQEAKNNLYPVIDLEPDDN